MIKELENAFDINSISYDEEKISKFIDFAFLLKQWNKKINLTALDEDKDIIYKHFVDSLLCLKANLTWNEKSIIDIGTGAGFPGIPLKITVPSLNVSLFDSLQKRINFLQMVVDKLDLQNVNCLHGRAEDYGKDINYRAKYDTVVARAVAKLPILLELCMPFVKKGGYFVALKGPELKNELEISKNALKILGAQVYEIKEFNLPVINHHRVIVVFEKIEETSEKYPRKAGIPQKRPL